MGWRESSNQKTGLILKRFKMRSMTKIFILRLIFKGSPSPFFKFCVGGSIVILSSDCSVTPTQSIVTRIHQIKSIFQPFNFAFGFLNLCMELITIPLKRDLNDADWIVYSANGMTADDQRANEKTER